MTLSAAEQYLLELMNRARLDPAGEAKRMGIDLNAGLAAGTIDATAKQVLAPNALLEAAATGHTLWMLEADVFSHTGSGGSSFSQRITAQGYDWFTAGENIAALWSGGTVTVEGAIETLNRNLFLSAGHRVNLMNDAYREVGLGAEAGLYTTGGITYNAAMLTEDFASRGTAHFLTGVAYTDADHNKFYSMGEGVAGVVFHAGGTSTTTAAAGGYALAFEPPLPQNGTGLTLVNVDVGAKQCAVAVDLMGENVKLDVVNGSAYYSSASVALFQGINDVVLLGVANLDAGGNGAGNHLTGNSGANRLEGLDGRDVLLGGMGRDVLLGGRGNDVLSGGKQADAFVFGLHDGVDRIKDFTVAGHDVLRLNDNLWSGTLTAEQVVGSFASVQPGEVVFDFGTDELHLTGVSTLAGLAAQIHFF